MRKRRHETIKAKLPVLRKEIYQGNPLINARKEFNTLETRLFLLGIRGINPHFSLKDKKYDKEFPELFIPTDKLTELLGGNTGYLHDLKSVCGHLFNTSIELNRDDGGFTLVNLFRRLDYVPNEGLHLQFDELMRPYLLDLFESKGYTKIDVEQIFYLTSPYASRLVELMLQYQNIPFFKMRQEIVRRMDMEKLRFSLNVPENAYVGRIDNFRQFVLDRPIAEINKKTIYNLSYKTMKQGRKVVGFEFHMDMRAVPVKDERLTYSTNAMESLLKLGFNKIAAREIVAACPSEEECLNRIVMAQRILQKQKVRKKFPIQNELGFLRSAIVKNWNLDSTGPPPDQVIKPPPPPSPRKIFEKNRKSKEAIDPPKVVAAEKTEISAGVQALIIEMLEDPKNQKYVELMLNSGGWTLEEFKEKYLKSSE